MNEDLANVSKDSQLHLCSGRIHKKTKLEFINLESITRNLLGQVSFAGGIWEGELVADIEESIKWTHHNFFPED